MTAGVAVDTQESVGEDAAREISADLALHESRRRRAGRPRSGEEGLELVAHDFVK
jgi:hypothetical protein